MALSPNKSFDLQVTGSNVNTWGIVNNSNFSIVDLGLGGRNSLSVAGAANVTVTANQSQNLMHILSGIITGNIQYIFPASGGIYMVENATTGAFTITIMCAGGTIGAIIPQGMRGIVFVNPDDLTVKVDLIGSNYSQGAAVSTGSANVQAVATMIPGPYLLINGALSFWIAGFSNTASMTLALGGTAAKTCKKLQASGYVNLAANDVTLNLPYLSVYDKANDVHVVLNPILGSAAYKNISAVIGDDGSGGLTILANQVTNAMLAQIATARFKGRTTAATGNVEDLTTAQATALLDAVVGDAGAGGTKGLVPAPAAGDAAANKFLKANGLWAALLADAATTLAGVSTSTAITPAGFAGNKSLGVNGYYKLPSGLTIQWGQAAGSGAFGLVTVTYPLAFTTVYSVVLTGAVGSVNDNPHLNTLPGNTTFDIRAGGSGDGGCCWIAIGLI